MSEIKNENYYIVHGWMINELKLKGVALQLYAIIYGFSQDGETEFSGRIKYLCDFTGAGRTTVINTLKSLVEDGHIKKISQTVNGVTFNRYSTTRTSTKTEHPVQNNNEVYYNSGSKIERGSTKIEPNKDKYNNIYLNNKIYSRVIDFLNEKTGKSYSDKSAQTRKLIDTRIKDGFTAEDFERVITNMASRWLGDEKMEQYLRPQTLFGTKFESYLNTKPKKGGAKFTEREYTQEDFESKIDDPLARYEKMLEGIEW